MPGSLDTSNNVYQIASVVFSVQMDASINLVGMDVSYNVTKALEYTQDISASDLSGILINKIADTADNDFQVTIDTTGFSKVNLMTSLNASLNPTATGATGWKDVSSGVTSNAYINQAVNFDLSGIQANGNDVWDKSISGACDSLINAAFDRAMIRSGSITLNGTISYSDLSENDFKHAHVLGVNLAYFESSGNIYNNNSDVTSNTTFGYAVATHIKDTSGTTHLDASSGFVADIIRQYTADHVEEFHHDGGLTDTTNGLKENQTVVEMITNKGIELILQIRGNATGGGFEIINNTAFSLHTSNITGVNVGYWYS